ncbi:porin family protein [Aridibaculum aurantiacum]|uniref:porin family protein n=1 Tax=Aridibaculum aurantiacum TaxID=2810307 RepID=UPI001A9783C7|nr:porin family protein [Aridibaculum aurantiacum]
MKTFLLTALAFCLVSGTAFSQGFRLGVKAGANLTKVSGKSFNEEFDLGYQLGAFSEIDFSKKFGIQPELLYSQINTKRSSGFNSIYNNISDPNASSDIQLKYLSIPILLRYNIGNTLTLNLGPQFSILVDDNENLLRNGEKAFSKGDFGMVGGVTLNLSRLRVYGRYIVGLNNINDIDDQDKWKSQQIQLGLGLRL